MGAVRNCHQCKQVVYQNQDRTAFFQTLCAVLMTFNNGRQICQLGHFDCWNISTGE